MTPILSLAASPSRGFAVQRPYDTVHHDNSCSLKHASEAGIRWVLLPLVLRTD